MDYKEIQVRIRDTIKGSCVEINIYVDLHGYIVASREIRGDAGGPISLELRTEDLFAAASGERLS
jgi:hypothetical protein